MLTGKKTLSPLTAVSLLTSLAEDDQTCISFEQCLDSVPNQQPACSGTPAVAEAYLQQLARCSCGQPVVAHSKHLVAL
jgi:hypothetical protein